MARLFVELNPAEVVGLVLIDPTNEDAAIAAGQPGLVIIERWIYAALGEIGLLRIVGRALVSESIGGHAPAEVLDRVPFLYGSHSQVATIAELDASVESAKEVRAIPPANWKDLSVVVISAANTAATDREHHQALARLTSRGRQVLATTGGHYVHYDDPRLVVELIRSVAERVAK